jgi:hypothetical protein
MVFFESAALLEASKVECIYSRPYTGTGVEVKAIGTLKKQSNAILMNVSVIEF